MYLCCLQLKSICTLDRIFFCDEASRLALVVQKVAQLSGFAMTYPMNIEQLLDEVGPNIVICTWRVDQLFAETEG